MKYVYEFQARGRLYRWQLSRRAVYTVRAVVVLVAVAIVLAAVYACRLTVGDLIAQGGQVLFWRLGWHRLGAAIIGAGDWLAFL